MSHIPSFESAEYYTWAGLPKSFVLVHWSGLAPSPTFGDKDKLKVSQGGRHTREMPIPTPTGLGGSNPFL